MSHDSDKTASEKPGAILSWFAADAWDLFLPQRRKNLVEVWLG